MRTVGILVRLIRGFLGVVALASLGIATAVVSYHAVRAARANPVHSLRAE